MSKSIDIKSKYKYIVIGAGSGGLTVAVGLSSAKKDVLLVSENLGGECTNSGCVPSKASIKIANSYINEASLENKARIKDNFYKKIQNTISTIQKEENALIESSNIQFCIGRAQFTSKETIEVTSPEGIKKTIHFDKAIISTGSTPRELPNIDIPKEKILTNENIFELKTIPNSITIMGAGPIGAELSFTYAKLGVKVTLISHSKLLARENSELKEPIRTNLKNFKVKLYENTEIQKYDTKKDSLSIKTTEGLIEIEGSDYYLVSIGRKPNTNLNLESAGIKYDKKGITVNKNYQTTNKKAYAIGDCIDAPKFTHLANNQGRFIVKKAIFPFSSNKFSPLPSVTYTDPPISAVGQIETSKYIEKFAINFNKSDRGIIDGTTELYGNVYVHMLTGKIVGANLVGDFSEHVINFFTLAIKKKVKVFEIGNFMVPYPTYLSGINQLYSSFIKKYLDDLKKNLFQLLKDNLLNLTAAIFWITIAITMFTYLRSIDFNTQVLASQLYKLFTSPIGILLFILAYSLRAFISFPASILTILAGSIYGFVPGLILVILASNLSTSIAYLLGKTVFTHQGTAKEHTGLLGLITKNPFESVLIARLTFFPYDLLSYICGAMKIRFWPFIFATAIGSIPGTIAFVSFGASIESIEDLDEFQFEPKYIALGVLLIAFSLIISYFVKKQKSNS